MKINKTTFKFNTVAAATIVIIIAIAVILNVIASNIIKTQLDLTPDKDFTMSEDAKAELAGVDKEIEIIGLFDEVKQDLGEPSQYDPTFFTDLYLQGKLNKGNSDYNRYIETYGELLGITSLSNLSVMAVIRVLEQFSSENSNIKVSYHDPDSDTLFIKKNVPGALANDFNKGDFIVKCGDIVKRVTSVELCRYRVDTSGSVPRYLPTGPNIDSAFLSAILYVAAEKRPVIGVTTNHGEDYDPGTGFIKNYNLLKNSLEDNTFIIKEVNKITSKEDLEGIDILLLMNPKSDITEREADILNIDYLVGGGSLIVAVDPGRNSPDFKNLNSVLASFNLKLNNDLISTEDTTEYNANSGLCLNITAYNPEVMMGVFPVEKYYVEIPSARSVSYISTTVSSIRNTDIIRTNGKAYTTDYVTGEIIPGIKSVGFAAEDVNAESKALVLGSAAFLSDGVSTRADAVEAFVRMCSWMKRYSKVYIPPKIPVENKILISESGISSLGWIAIIFIPLLSFTTGIFIWIRRRHL